MKLLIDIPEHIYEHAKEMSEDSRDEGEAMRAIANGSPQESCCDAISRQAVLDIITFEDKWLFDANGHNANTHITFSGLESRAKALPSVTPQPCEDCISRQAAIKAIEALQRPIMREESNYYQFKFSGMSEALGAVENLPSVTPQQKTGRWIQKEEEDEAEPFIIWECSECHCVDEDGKPSYKYCPQCGAKMEVEE